MKYVVFTILLMFSFISKAQEFVDYSIPVTELKPALSFIKEIKSETNFQLTEIDLTRDLRKESLKDQPSMMIVEKPKYKSIQVNYNVAIPDSNFKVYVNQFNTNRLNNRVYTSGLQNNAYKDASENTFLFYPVQYRSGETIY